MCRLTVYKGSPVLLGDIIVIPENSLVCQSRDAGYHPGVVDKCHIRNIRVNGDGFGVAFYGQAIQTGACLFKFVTPAWSNKNLISISQFVYSNLIMGHIRAATSGIDPFEPQSVSIENCHPFKYGRWCLMHNGGIPRFSKIKLQLLNLLDQDCFQFISGSTDSEHIFALFLSLLPDRTSQLDVKVITDTLETTISVILKLCEIAAINEASSLNLVVSDGIHVVATRFRNGLDAPPSLYYNYGNKFLSSEGTFEKPGNDESCEIVISSAPLCKGFYMEDGGSSGMGSDCGWVLAPKNSMLVCEGDTKDFSKITNIYIQGIGLKSARYLSKHLKIGTTSFLSQFSMTKDDRPSDASHKQAIFPSPKIPDDAFTDGSSEAAKTNETQTCSTVESNLTAGALNTNADATEDLSTSQHSIYKTIFTHKSSSIEMSSNCASGGTNSLARSPSVDSLCCSDLATTSKPRHSLRNAKIKLESYDVTSKNLTEFVSTLGSPDLNFQVAEKARHQRPHVWWTLFDISWRILVLSLLIYIAALSRRFNSLTCPN